MKHLILLVSLLILSCDTTTAPQSVQFDVVYGSKAVEGEEVKLYNNSVLIDYGDLPISIAAMTGEVLRAKFDVHVTNFPLNHPQCDCETITPSHYRCTEDYTVDGNDWEVGK